MHSSSPIFNLFLAYWLYLIVGLSIAEYWWLDGIIRLYNDWWYLWGLMAGVTCEAGRAHSRIRTWRQTSFFHLDVSVYSKWAIRSYPVVLSFTNLHFPFLYLVAWLWIHYIIRYLSKAFVFLIIDLSGGRWGSVRWWKVVWWGSERWF